MRKIIVVFVLLAIAAVGTPYFIGTKVETALRENLAQYDDLPLYVVGVESYDRGIFSAKAIVAVGIEEEYMAALGGDVELPTGEEGFQLYIDIEHGPVLRMHGFSLGWADMGGSVDRETYPEWHEVFDVLGNDKLLSWGLHVGLGGSGWANSDISNQNIVHEEDGEKFEFELAGYDDSLTFTDYGKHIVSNMSLESMSLSVEGEQAFQVSMSDLNAESDFSMADTLWMGTGTGEFGIGHIQVSAEDTFNTEFHEFYAHVSVTDGNSSETINLRESFLIESADFNGYKVDDAELTFSYNNITKALLEVQMTNPELFAGNENGQLTPEAQATLQQLFGDALRHGPEIAFEKIAFNSDEGSLDMSASAAIDSARAGSVDLNNIFTLIPAVTVLADLEISEALLRSAMLFKSRSDAAGLPAEEQPTEEEMAALVDSQVGMVAGMLGGQGFVTIENGNYSTSFSFSQGVATLNGKPVPLPGF